MSFWVLIGREFHSYNLVRRSCSSDTKYQALSLRLKLEPINDAQNWDKFFPCLCLQLPSDCQRSGQFTTHLQFVLKTCVLYAYLYYSCIRIATLIIGRMRKIDLQFTHTQITYVRHHQFYGSNIAALHRVNMSVLM